MTTSSDCYLLHSSPSHAWEQRQGAHLLAWFKDRLSLGRIPIGPAEKGAFRCRSFVIDGDRTSDLPPETRFRNQVVTGWTERINCCSKGISWLPPVTLFPLCMSQSFGPSCYNLALLKFMWKGGILSYLDCTKYGSTARWRGVEKDGNSDSGKIFVLPCQLEMHCHEIACLISARYKKILGFACSIWRTNCV